MKYKYHKLLDPDLYSNKQNARFVEIMHEKCINESSENLAKEKLHRYPSNDYILSLLEETEKKAQNEFLNVGIVIPSFTIYKDNQPIVLKFKTPTNPKQLRNLQVAGKCFALINCAHSIFFSTMCPHDNSNISFEDSEESDLGIYVCGSTMTGLYLDSLTKLISTKTKIGFCNINRKISRTKSKYPVNDLFTIQSTEEMNEILECVPTIIKLNTELDEKTCLINFATSLKMLSKFK